MSIGDKIIEAARRQDEEERKFREEQAEEERKWQIRERLKSDFLSYCREARPIDYARWLKGYLIDGDVTHVSGNNMPTGWYVLQSNIAPELPEFYGSQSINLIVPMYTYLKPFSRTFHGNSGHNSIFFMEDYSKIASDVWVYVDVAKHLVEPNNRKSGKEIE